MGDDAPFAGAAPSNDLQALLDKQIAGRAMLWAAMDIRTALRDRGFRQRDLALRLNVPESTVSRWLAWAHGRAGGIAIPTTALSTISEMTGIPPAELLRGLAQRAVEAA